MQIYMVTWEGQKGTPDCFRNYGDIKPSILISYSTCQNVKVVETPTSGGPVKFVVTGNRGKEYFEETLYATRYPVWDSPSHL